MHISSQGRGAPSITGDLISPTDPSITWLPQFWHGFCSSWSRERPRHLTGRATGPRRATRPRSGGEKVEGEEYRAPATGRSSCTVVLTILFLAAMPARASVIVDGKEWMQPADLTSVSWYEVSAGTNGVLGPDVAGPCDETTGACDGTLNGIDVTGWTWASVDEVAALLVFVTATYNGGVDDAVHPGGIGIAFGAGKETVWATAMFDTLGFVPTSTGPEYREVLGTTRTPKFELAVYRGSVLDASTAYVIPDRATTDDTTGPNVASSLWGHWLYRDAASVTAPPPALLLAGGFAGMVWMRWRSVGDKAPGRG